MVEIHKRTDAEMIVALQVRVAWCEMRINKLNATLRNMVEYFGMQYTGEEDEFYAGDENRKL
jgi:hypothetical protein